MPKARDYQLNEAELQAVETAIRRDKPPEVRQRCTAIRLLHLGHKPEQVAEMQAVSIPTIYAWINRWRKGGIEELATKPRSGRPPKADEAYSRRLDEVLEKETAELGYGFTMWTIDRLRAHLAKETGKELSESRRQVAAGVDHDAQDTTHHAHAAAMPRSTQTYIGALERL